MSLVYLTYHDENIHDFDKVDGEEKPQKFQYTSKFRATIKQEFQQPRFIATTDGKKLLTASGKYDHRTMGFVRTPLNPPNEFMRKNHGIKWLRINDHVCPKDMHLPPVPTHRSIADIKPATARANFIALNIERVKRMQPKRPNPRYIDTANGDCHYLENTGLIPQYVNGKNFGKVPCFIQSHKKIIMNKNRAMLGGISSINDGGHYFSLFGIRKLTNEERETMLDGLKANFLEQSKIFQRLSLHTDTLAKKMRKTRIENSLRQLEQDIYLIEQNSCIYISNY